MTRYELTRQGMRESPGGAWVRFEDVPQWRPIETAPKDRTLTLMVCCQANGEPLIWIGPWQRIYDQPSYVARPTHWQPLPPAPTPPRGETP